MSINYLGKILSSGLPTQGTDATGEDTYATVVTAPGRVTHYASIYCVTQDAIVSFDGGTTDHLTIAAGVQHLFSGLEIPAGAVIQAKNKTGGANYASMFIAVW